MVGLPVMNPVVVLNVNPAGNTGSMLYVKVPPPPVAVTGANGVVTIPTFNVVEGTASVVTMAGGDCTVRLNVRLPLADAVSVTLTVNVVVAVTVVGVPVTSPVLMLKLNPSGKGLSIAKV